VRRIGDVAPGCLSEASVASETTTPCDVVINGCDRYPQPAHVNIEGHIGKLLLPEDKVLEGEARPGSCSYRPAPGTDTHAIADEVHPVNARPTGPGLDVGPAQ
jgi:hypothetical protein